MVPLGTSLTQEQARQGEEAVVFALLKLAKQAEFRNTSTSPSTPSGMVAPFQKPNTHSHSRKAGCRA